VIVLVTRGDHCLLARNHSCSLICSSDNSRRVVDVCQFSHRRKRMSCINAPRSMGTMDIVHLHGGSPANFLDVGGGATKERVVEAFKIILSDSNVKAVLINIFGGIVRCDLIADGVIGAVEEVGVKIPVVVRLEGNNAELGTKKLAESGLSIIAATSLTDAAQQAVKAAGGN